MCQKWLLFLAKLADRCLVAYVALQIWLNTTEGILFPTTSGLFVHARVSAAHARSPNGRGVFSETPKQFHFTLSSTTNPWTLNQVIVCLGCLTCLIVMLYLFDFHWRVVGRFMSNAEYAMLLVYVSDGKNGFLKVMHTEILCFCLFFAVSCVLIIPVPRHDLIWLLAFLRNRFWWKDNSDGQVMELKANSIQLCIQRFSHCASFNIVCGLHPGNMLSEYNWNTVYSLNRDIFEAPPPLPFLSISLFFYLLKTKAPCVVVLF